MTRLATTIGWLVILVLLLLPRPVISADGEIVRSFLEITPDNLEDLDALLVTLEQSLLQAPPGADVEPIVIILHGDEAFPFTRSRYASNKALVDRTAVLDAYELIDVKMCETWMKANGVSRDDLLPFIDTVPFAPDEARRLEADGYQPFGSVNM
jgi:intracellular sulfur oxidation DsrE/DsrF family protein